MEPEIEEDVQVEDPLPGPWVRIKKWDSGFYVGYSEEKKFCVYGLGLASHPSSFLDMGTLNIRP